jgi:hypothetical protein
LFGYRGGADIIAPEWSEHLADRRGRNVWSCADCGEDTVYLSARELIEDDLIMHDGLMSESNNSRSEAEKCLRKANSCEDNQDRWAWRVLAESWVLLAEINDIVESRNSVEANSKVAPSH